MNRQRVQPASDRLLEQTAVIGADFRELGHVTTEAAREGVGHVRDAAMGYLDAGRKKIGKMGKSAEHYVTEQPVKALALAAGAGLLLGYLFSRRGR